MLPAAACGVVETDRVLTYLAGETAGQCGPCHVGLPAIARLFHEVTIGTARPSGLDVLERWSSDVLGRGACRHPDGAMFFLSSALRVFAADLRHHLRHGACRFTANVPHLPIPDARQGLVVKERLRVDPIKCKAHGMCAELIPERIRLDDWGYPIVDARALTQDLSGHARRAVTECPRGALADVEVDQPGARDRPHDPD